MHPAATRERLEPQPVTTGSATIAAITLAGV